MFFVYFGFSPISGMYFSNIFPVVACLFIVLTASFMEEELLILMKSDLLFFSFRAFDIVSKSWPNKYIRNSCEQNHSFISVVCI